MEFSLQRADLLRELTLSQGVLERKATIPILSNVLLEVSEGTLRLTGTDLELGIRSSCPAKVKKEGATTAPGKKLFDYIRQLEEGEIKFKVSDAAGGSMQLSSGRSHVRMAGMSRESFPVLPDFPGKLATIPPKVLQAMIARTIFAISEEESRYTLNAALLILKGDTMTMVATDGHRLAHVEAEPAEEQYSGVKGGEIRVLVPRKAMAELSKLLGDAPEEGGIEFGKDDNHLFFRIGPRLLICRMLTGQFPNYEAVLPKACDKVAVIENNHLTAAIRRVSLFSDERTHTVKLQLGKDELKVTATGSEAGECEESVAAEYGSPPLLIGFNWQYLTDFLAAAGAEKINMEFKDEQSASQMTPATADKLKYRYVVMPMRV
jgi:DNA polymerase III subunit beta